MRKISLKYGMYMGAIGFIIIVRLIFKISVILIAIILIVLALKFFGIIS